jgi:hypothetical protein
LIRRNLRALPESETVVFIEPQSVTALIVLKIAAECVEAGIEPETEIGWF